MRVKRWTALCICLKINLKACGGLQNTVHTQGDPFCERGNINFNAVAFIGACGEGECGEGDQGIFFIVLLPVNFDIMLHSSGIDDHGMAIDAVGFAGEEEHGENDRNDVDGAEEQPKHPKYH